MTFQPAKNARIHLWYTLFLLLYAMQPVAGYYPNDPYFLPGDDDSELEGYPGQWYLHNLIEITSVNVGLDVNIIGAWSMGYTGAGVIIGIIDDGVQGNHPDLQTYFHNAYSWDFGKTRQQNLLDAYRGSPVMPDSNHGTAVAGVALATGGNGIGMSGAAPHAGLASLKYMNSPDPEGRHDSEVHAAAILFQGQTDVHGNPDPYTEFPLETPLPVRIKNHSYVISQSYQLQPAIIPQALKTSLNHGVIHVFGAGNARTPDAPDVWDNADTGKIELQNQPGAIVVAAIGSNGKFSTYSNFGSNVFVTAPSNSDGAFAIPTTDRSGPDGYNDQEVGPDPIFHLLDEYDYSARFGGTSSSAPLVSGILALGMEANPNMNARMAQHILARTSRVIDPGDNNRHGGWVQNGAGHSFNRNYGFGLIDATAYVEMALEAQHVTPQTVHESPTLSVGQSFVDNSPLLFTYTPLISPELVQPIEYVSVGLRITGLQTDWTDYSVHGIGTIQGDLYAWLTSPQGTRQLLFSDDRDMTGEYAELRSMSEDTLAWNFLSYAYWGEDPTGEWTLELYNASPNAPSGVWEQVDFNIGMGDLVLVPEPYAFTLLLAVFWLLVPRIRPFRHIS